ncbi:MAG: hypothetical protein F6J98_28375 [Moorea sp. SIO4G2]|nr:hypothetical protein [Moorena sp. SIO4G2]
MEHRIIKCQFLVVSGQRSAVSNQRTAISRQPLADSTSSSVRYAHKLKAIS